MPDSSENSAESRRVLLVAAHPDDPEFACAGTMAKWAQAGNHITYVLLTSGDKGSHDPSLRPGMLGAAREAEQLAAAHELGVEDVVFLRHPDGTLENTMELRRELCSVLRCHRPDVVFAIDPWRHYQLHPDHRVAGQAALDAIYAAREWYIFPEQLIAGIEPWRVREACLYWTGEPDYWEDITATIDKRISALFCHTTQTGTDITRLSERVKGGAHENGLKAGCEYAEGFKRFQFPGARQNR